VKRNKALTTLFFFNGIFVFGGSLLGPLYSIYVEGITGNIISVSTSWAVFMFVATLGTAVAAQFGDALKEKEYLLLAGFLLRAIGWFCFLFATSYMHILLIQVILGIGEAVGTPSFDAIFAEHLDKGKHVNEYSSWKVLNNLVGTIGTIIGGIVATRWGFPILFIGMGVLAIISFIGILTRPRKLL